MSAAAARLPASSPAGQSMAPGHSMEADGAVSSSPDLVEAIARRVVELLREEPAAAVSEPVLWTTGRVAAELGRSAEWVRDHRVELGVVTTSGRRPRLMFEAAAVRAWATAREGARGTGERSQATESPPTLSPRRSRRASMGTAADLLPIRGESRAA